MIEKIHYFMPAIVLSALLLAGGHAFAQKKAPSSAPKIDPIVSAQWLKANLNLEGLVVVDIRTAEEYKSGHIPNSVNVPFVVPVSEWIATRDNLILELPDKDALFKTIGSCGIKPDSPVVIVTTTAKPPEPPYPLANATRVADTLIYAGVKDVAILDGGYPKWLAEKGPVTMDAPVVRRSVFKGKTNNAIFVSREYVRKHIGKAVIIDARDADVYFGAAVEPFADKPGHIPSAKSLPAPWMWTKDGSYKDVKILKAMAAGVIGSPKSKEVIVYCGVGGYASSWWFVLTQVLKYPNVKFYDGSAQEWVRSNKMTAYKWE